MPEDLPPPQYRHYCPLCPWTLESPVEDDDPEATGRVVVDAARRTFDTAVSTPAEFMQRAAFIQLLASQQSIERALRAHCESHPIEQWLTAAVKLFTIRQSLGVAEEVPRPSDERVLAAIYAGELTVNDGRWIRAAAGIIDAVKATKAAVDA